MVTSVGHIGKQESRTTTRRHDYHPQEDLQVVRNCSPITTSAGCSLLLTTAETTQTRRHCSTVHLIHLGVEVEAGVVGRRYEYCVVRLAQEVEHGAEDGAAPRHHADVLRLDDGAALQHAPWSLPGHRSSMLTRTTQQLYNRPPHVLYMTQQLHCWSRQNHVGGTYVCASEAPAS